MNDFNDDAATFAEHWAGLADPARHRIADALAITRGTAVLDVGCGSGDFAAHALARGATVSGIDVAPAMIAIARERAQGAELSVGAMERLPYEDGAFDAVTGFNSLQFADDPVAALREWMRVAKPGGSIAICSWAERERREVDVVEDALRQLVGEQAGPAFGPRLEAIAQEAGLEIVASDDVEVPFEVPDQERLELAFLFDARGCGAVERLGEAGSRAAITAAAAPFRRRDGSYRFENSFVYVIGTR